MQAVESFSFSGAYLSPLVPLDWAREWVLDAILQRNPEAAKHFLSAFLSKNGYRYGSANSVSAITFLEDVNSDSLIESGLLDNAENELLRALQDGALQAEGLIASDLNLEIDLKKWLDEGGHLDPLEFSFVKLRQPAQFETIGRSWWYDTCDLYRFAAGYALPIKFSTENPNLLNMIGTNRTLNMLLKSKPATLTRDVILKALKLALANDPPVPSSNRRVCPYSRLVGFRHNVLLELSRKRQGQKITRSASHISINRAHLQRVFGNPQYAKDLLSSENMSPDSRPNAGGRPVIHNWEGMLIEACRLIHEKGFPKVQNDLVNDLAQWFIDKSDNHPNPSQIKKRVTALYRACRIERE